MCFCTHADCPSWKTTKTWTIIMETLRPSCWTDTRVGLRLATSKRNSAPWHPLCWAPPKVCWFVVISTFSICHSNSSAIFLLPSLPFYRLPSPVHHCCMTLVNNNPFCFHPPHQESCSDWEPFWNPHNDTYIAHHIYSNWLKTRFVSRLPKTDPDILLCWPLPSNLDCKYVYTYKHSCYLCLIPVTVR